MFAMIYCPQRVLINVILMNFSHLLCKDSGADIASPSRQRGKTRLTDTERFASVVKRAFKCVLPTLWNFMFCFLTIEGPSHWGSQNTLF